MRHVQNMKFCSASISANTKLLIFALSSGDHDRQSFQVVQLLPVDS